jgi:hypothetical protein
MNIKEFLQVCEDFFKQIHPLMDYNEDEDEDIEKLKKTSDELLEENNDEESFYNFCYIMRNTMLLINTKMK